MFHTVNDRFAVGGDIQRNDGTGNVSIYGGTFPDENFSLMHSVPYLLSMYSDEPDKNGSQFMINFEKAPELDGKYVVFGQVVEGLSIIK